MRLTDRFAPTVGSLHAVAEHVVAVARYRAVGRIGLTARPGGFGTPPFDGRVVRVDGIRLVVEEGGAGRQAPLTTLRAAAEFAGVTPGMPADVYPPATPLDLDRPLEVDVAAAAALAGWYALGDEAMRPLVIELSDHSPSDLTLWPEHFDLGFSAGEVNFGVSPGDDSHGEPYAYVGPWARPLPGDRDFWNEPFGASRPHTEVTSVDGLLGFFRSGWSASLARHA